MSKIEQADSFFEEFGYKSFGQNEPYYRKELKDVYELQFNIIPTVAESLDEIRIQISYELRIPLVAKLDQEARPRVAKEPVSQCGWIARSPYDYLSIEDLLPWIATPPTVEKNTFGEKWRTLRNELGHDIENLESEITDLAELQSYIVRSRKWDWSDGSYSPAIVMALNGDLGSAVAHMMLFDSSTDANPWLRNHPHSSEENDRRVEMLRKISAFSTRS